MVFKHQPRAGGLEIPRTSPFADFRPPTEATERRVRTEASASKYASISRMLVGQARTDAARLAMSVRERGARLAHELARLRHEPQSRTSTVHGGRDARCRGSGWRGQDGALRRRQHRHGRAWRV